MVDSSWHKVSIGVGCDRCGLCPIIGDRYQCKDCKERSGYDLCGDCHNTNSKLPRRFKQKHTQEHRLELVKAVMSRDVIYILLSNQLSVVSAASRSQSNPNQRLESPSSSLNHNNDDDDDDGNGDGVVGSTESQSHKQTHLWKVKNCCYIGIVGGRSKVDFPY